MPASVEGAETLLLQAITYRQDNEWLPALYTFLVYRVFDHVHTIVDFHPAYLIGFVTAQIKLSLLLRYFLHLHISNKNEVT